MKCKLCNSQLQELRQKSPNILEIDCPTCGIYNITDTINRAIEGNSHLPAISCHIKNHSSGTNPITINNKFLETVNLLPSPKSVLLEEKINQIILYIGKNSPYIDEHIDLPINNLFTNFYCANGYELESLLNHLENSSLIIRGRAFTSNSKKQNENDSNTIKVKLTINGWKEYDRLRTKIIDSKQAFIAMSFAPEHEYIFTEAIELACKACKYDPQKMNLLKHNNKICNQIIAEIRRSKFLIADFTGQNNEVYFEAGFARGLNIPVIWCCKKGDLKNLHFDTRQYNHIAWETTEQLKNELIDMIDANVY